MSMSVRRLLVVALVAALGGGVTQAIANPARKPSAKPGGGVTQAIANPARKPSAKPGGGAAAQAVANPAKKPQKHRAAARKAAAKKASARARAVKLGAGVAWVPLGALAGAPPLTGTTGAPAALGSGSLTVPPATADPTSGYIAPPPGPGDGPTPPSVQAVGVAVDDRTGYTARLSRTGVTAGAVVVQLINQGEDDHNLRVVPTDHAGAAVDFPLTGSGQNTTKTLALTAGSYRLFCTLTTPVNHETAGMAATLTVS
jgi:plastocyanin